LKEGDIIFRKNHPDISYILLKERYPKSAMKARIPNTIKNNKVKIPK